jgi:phosphopantetheine--protein transferase-like protein
MILGIGTDIVAPARFIRWQHYPLSRLKRVFSDDELAAATVQGLLVSEKLAVRFAAKEAFYKALAAMLVYLGKTHKPASLLAVCKGVEVVNTTWQVPILVVDWDYLQELFACTLPLVRVDCSLAHEKEMVVAFVILSGGYAA